MRHSSVLTCSLSLFALLQPALCAQAKPERVLLSNIKSLTLRKDLMTTANRVSAVPQLKAIGGNAKGLYDIDVLRCKNAGSGYDEADIQWTCTASLPAEFKLGGTEVICEGFSSPTDPYILKGSCGVEYRLMLTEVGEQRYGKGKADVGNGENWWDWQGDAQRSKSGDVGAIVFWIVFIGVVGWMIWSAFIRDGGAARRPRAAGGGGGYGGGWGGGGGGGEDPPPPYDDYGAPPRKANIRSSGPAQARQQQQQGWRPGFWTGTAAGAAGAYLAGRGTRGQAQERPQQQTQRSSWTRGHDEGSSSSSSGGYGYSRHESSGFGGTSRR